MLLDTFWWYTYQPPKAADMLNLSVSVRTPLLSHGWFVCRTSPPWEKSSTWLAWALHSLLAMRSWIAIAFSPMDLRCFWVAEFDDWKTWIFFTVGDCSITIPTCHLLIRAGDHHRIRAGLLGGSVWMADGAELLLIGSVFWKRKGLGKWCWVISFLVGTLGVVCGNFSCKIS